MPRHVSESSNANLRNHRAALAARTTDPADVLIVGDSFVGNFRRTAPEKRFLNHLRDSVQLRWAGALQGSGYHPCAPDNGAAQSNWTFGGAPAQFFGFGLARMCTGLSTAAHSATLLVDCDRFHLAYSQTSTTGTMGVSIDGGPIQSIVTAGSPNKSTRLWDSGALGAGVHKVVVTWVSGNIVLLDGLMAYKGDFASGIRFWDSGYGGTKASDHYTATTYSYTGCDNIKPNLVLLHFGTNELIAGVSAADFTANLKTLADHILALCPSPKPSIGVLLAWPTSGSDPTLTVANWAAYRTAARALCAQNGYELLDFYDIVGDLGATDPLDVAESDILHPNKNGAYLYADEIVKRFFGGPLASRASGTRQVAPPATIIPVGDSHVARAVSSTDNESFSGVGFVAWMQALSHERLKLIRNAGVAGQGTAAILARLQADVIAYSPGYCLYCAGINDINPASGLTAAQVQANILPALDLLQAADIFTLITTVFPANFVNTTSSKTELAKLNAWIRSLGEIRKGVRVVDVYPKIANPANVFSTGTLSWATGLDADGVHSSSKGAKIIGQEIANAINLLVPRISPLPGSSADPFELIPNPMMTGNAAGLATGVQTMATVGALPTVSKVARTDGIQGEWQQAVVAAGASNRIMQNATAGSFADGNVVIATIEVDEDPSSFFADTHGLTVQALNAAGDTILGSRFFNFLGTEHAPTGSVFRTPPFTLPAGTAAGTLRVYWHVTAAAGGPVTVRIGRMSLRKVGT